MISNRPEFMIADLAAMTLGATPFSIYLTSAPDQVRYVIGDAEAKVAIVEEPFRPLVTGLVDDDWQTTDTTPVASVVWASCSAQRNLNINTQLRVVAPAAGPESYVTEDTTDGSIVTLFHIALMPCP